MHLGREAGHADILDTGAQQAMGDTGEELALAAAVWCRENTNLSHSSRPHSEKPVVRLAAVSTRAEIRLQSLW